MNTKELAALLNEQPYPIRLSKDLKAQAKAAGLVVVTGNSDDIMSFDGAVYDEVGCYDGGTAYLKPTGLLKSKCECEDCPYFSAIKEKAATIEALWCPEGTYRWMFKTEIPHETFEVIEDGEAHSRCLVFALADVRT